MYLCPDVTPCAFCLAGVKWKLMNVRLTRVEMVAPAWIALTCFCVSAHPATAAPSVIPAYVSLLYLNYLI